MLEQPGAHDVEPGPTAREASGPDARQRTTHGAARSAVLRTLLRIPLFYKILIANAVIVMLGAVLGTLVTMEFLRAEPGHSPVELVALLALAGVLVTLLVNALILRLALAPISQLENTAACVQRGELDARAPLSPIADRELERLTRTFNAMLDNLESYRQRVRDVAAHALNAEEEERKRVARELHDETAQTLAALLIRLRVARGVEDPGAREALLEEVRREVASALEGVRRFARGLRPPALDELGLIPALESHVRGVVESAGVPVQIDAESLEARLSPQAELALYRIVQEALANAIRHAGATQVRVSIGRQGEVVTAGVEDDGHGFDRDHVMRAGGRGLGLYGMQERAAYLGGRVTITSRPGFGTRIQAEIPISEASAYV
jgi:two-component system sensor histidine kinase UhpB